MYGTRRSRFRQTTGAGTSVFGCSSRGSLAGDRHEVRVIAREPGVDAEPARELATGLHAVLVTAMTAVAGGGNDLELVQVGTGCRPGHKHIT